MKTTFIAFLMSIGMISYSQNIPMYVGTYTEADSEGIYSYDFNTITGEISNKKLAVETKNPSFITFSSDKKFMYAVNENGENSFVNSYLVNENRTLSLLNKESSNGLGPCHVQLNKKNDKLVVSNYGGGSFSIYPILKNGNIQKATHVFNHSIATKISHAHSAKFYKNKLFVADLGRGFLAEYNLNKGSYSLKENHLMKENAGPRHFEISKKGKYIFIINELNSTISVLKKNKNSFTNIQNISTLSDDYTGENACADIHLSKDEQFLYGSNRGENSIVVFKRNKRNGTLQKIQNISVYGDWPRNFTLAPNGEFLLVANKKSKNISVYKVNKTSGKLTFSHSINAPTPVCLLFEFEIINVISIIKSKCAEVSRFWSFKNNTQFVKFSIKNIYNFW